MADLIPTTSGALHRPRTAAELCDRPARQDDAASFSLIVWTRDEDGALLIFDILEPKARYARKVWSSIRRHALAGRITMVDVKTGGPSGPLARRIAAADIA